MYSLLYLRARVIGSLVAYGLIAIIVFVPITVFRYNLNVKKSFKECMYGFKNLAEEW
jgi:hypothetical protein